MKPYKVLALLAFFGLNAVGVFSGLSLANWAPKDISQTRIHKADVGLSFGLGFGGGGYGGWGGGWGGHPYGYGNSASIGISIPIGSNNRGYYGSPYYRHRPYYYPNNYTYGRVYVPVYNSYNSGTNVFYTNTPYYGQSVGGYRYYRF